MLFDLSYAACVRIYGSMICTYVILQLCAFCCQTNRYRRIIINECFIWCTCVVIIHVYDTSCIALCVYTLNTYMCGTRRSCWNQHVSGSFFFVFKLLLHCGFTKKKFVEWRSAIVTFRCRSNWRLNIGLIEELM